MLNQTFKNGPRAKATITHLRAGEVLDVQEVGNIVTHAGLAAIHAYIYATPAQRAGLSNGFNFIALSDDSSPPSAFDIQLPGELAQHGLERAQAEVLTAAVGSSATVVQYTFTFTGVEQSVQKTALFDAPAGGRMAHEILFARRVLRANDTLQMKFTINLGDTELP